MRRILALTSVIVAVSVVVPGPSGAVEARERYRAPVDAPIVDRFRPPEKDWLPGNRGIKYGTEPGRSITAIGPGTVTYAGRIGDDLHVTIAHPDGLRSSYSFLASIRLAEGDRVRGGDLVGAAGGLFHLGIRRGDRYLDPESIIGTTVGGGRVRLVPLDGSPTARRPRAPIGPASAGVDGTVTGRSPGGLLDVLRRRPWGHWGPRPSTR